ncbi:hypothetical protein CS022_02765 [Veronia nyctiphanis]|uniref:Uncharacterized protein n=1 Tax=Veronia nyctiphanis TaxID=1278244 RepID=A0A4Q0YUN4_9GAMM|nr:hypothetical protein [Veronia nyctiphanis]RXJ74515.1 hypothetical protein CS022_02765 [Veronia nyctiphanis]
MPAAYRVILLATAILTSQFSLASDVLEVSDNGRKSDFFSHSNERGRLEVIKDSFVLSLPSWRNDTRDKLDIWNSWSIGVDVNPFMMSTDGKNFYVMGLLIDEKEMPDWDDLDGLTDWLLDQGVVMSVGRQVTGSDAIYRFDIRFRQNNDPEVLLQLQIPYR